jgi:hypothetical protein
VWLPCSAHNLGRERRSARVHLNAVSCRRGAPLSGVGCRWTGGQRTRHTSISAGNPIEASLRHSLRAQGVMNARGPPDEEAVAPDAEGHTHAKTPRASQHQVWRHRPSRLRARGVPGRGPGLLASRVLGQQVISTWGCCQASRLSRGSARQHLKVEPDGDEQSWLTDSFRKLHGVARAYYDRP